jgi:hypothetical protein
MVYLSIKDKKFEEAYDYLNKIENDKLYSDVRLTLLKSHVLFLMKKQKEAVINLTQFAEFNMKILS